MIRQAMLGNGELMVILHVNAQYATIQYSMWSKNSINIFFNDLYKMIKKGHIINLNQKFHCSNKITDDYSLGESMFAYEYKVCIPMVHDS